VEGPHSTPQGDVDVICDHGLKVKLSHARRFG
jgi:hypothetical protein